MSIVYYYIFKLLIYVRKRDSVRLMQKDFHYYATYCAAFLAGYTHEDALEICWSAQHVDNCTRHFLTAVKGPKSVATTQLSGELGKFPTNRIGRQEITRVWSAFHCLPYDLYASFSRYRSKAYKHRFRLICKPNGSLLKDTVELAKEGGNEAVGIAMHVLADTWAHSYFAGTPSLVINNFYSSIYEMDRETGAEKRIRLHINVASGDDLEANKYKHTVFQDDESSIMHLGHGRIGHLPDYSFIKYRYRPAWMRGDFVIKDNPSEYWHAFCQMVTAMQYLNGTIPEFNLDTYAEDTCAEWKDEIMKCICKRQEDGCSDWESLATKLSGKEIPPYNRDAHNQEYLISKGGFDTFLGRYFIAAKRHKEMVADAVRKSGNPLCGKWNSIFPYDSRSERKNVNKFKRFLAQKNAESLEQEDKQ